MYTFYHFPAAHRSPAYFISSACVLPAIQKADAFDILRNISYELIVIRIQ